MKLREQFNLVETEIGQGRMLIEASAGTGKTYTIAGLVLRLLIERPELTIDRILVTTFTELATAELRGRIRERLREAIHAFRSGEVGDELLRGFLDKYRDRSSAAQRLEDALVNFDEAPIYTIHGFCQRVLAERAFESGALFDRELVTNQTDLLREVAYDFWRMHFYTGEPFPALLALRYGITPETLREDLDELIQNPTLQVLPDDPPSLAKIIADLNAGLDALRASWRRDEKAIRRLFVENAWAKNKYKDSERMTSLLDDLEKILTGNGGPAQLESVEVFAACEIAKGVRVGFPPLTQRTFVRCEEIVDLASEFCVAVRVKFFAWAREELAVRKLARNVFSYDDLLTQLDAALAGPGGNELAKTIREKYQAALIDEFQDTDPVQYSIFSRIYHGSDAPVALIGDPKQAIYAFRGADVFTYLRAAEETLPKRRFTLGKNWRSETALVRAVNTIFGVRENPFLLPEIRFDPATSGGKADETPLRFGKKKEPPFRLWRVGKDGDLAKQIASEMVRLLNRVARIGEEPLEPSHLAVLTSTNWQAAQVQDALRTRNIPSVLYSTANVFLSHEARELRDVLAAVMQPGYEKFLRAALCTDAFGRTGNDLDAFTHDEAAWETELLRFQEFHQVWRTEGFIQMLRHLSAEYGVRRRLLSYPDGERRLTNFLHLAELLHQACVEHQLGMSGLLKWLGQRMQEESFAERVEHELRLESDEKAVRIITVHKSKGLEFDVVFCPFVDWVPREPRDTFHDSERRLTLDLADPDAHETERKTEARAELLRQFYVALTRARHRCALAWRPPAKGEDKSAPAYLLGSPSALPDEIETCADIAIADLPAASDEVWNSPLTEEATPLRPRQFTGEIDRSWGIASFTRLISGRETDLLDEGPLDELPVVEETETAVGIHDFPKGTGAGTCLHKILEEIDFTSLTTAPEIVQKVLRAHSIENRDDVVLENVRQLAALPLTSAHDSFALADVPSDARIAEMEFSFPVSALTIAKLKDAFALDELPLQIDRLQFQPINGFMNGFIDLVFGHNGRFYFADWKSNWLGPTTRAYHAAALAEEMRRNFYLLQLSLYSIALHRYLRVRQPGYDFERHFGGAFYVFLRGIDPAQPENGVFFQRPTRAFVEKLSRIFES